MLDLIIPPIVAGLVILSIHAYLGLHVIARGVIFVDLAFAQIAALGTTVATLMGIENGLGQLLSALGFTLLGALIFSFTRMEKSAVPQETIIGITFVVASAAVILIAGLNRRGCGAHPRDDDRHADLGRLANDREVGGCVCGCGCVPFRIPETISLTHVRSRGV